MGLTAATIAVVLTGAGCGAGEETRGFEVPKALCGTPIDAKLLEPVLPKSGQKISEELSDKIQGIRRCRVSVDGELVLSASTEWWGKGTTTVKVASSQMGVRLDEHVSEDRSYTYADMGGTGHVTCPDPKNANMRENGELFTTVFITKEGIPDESAMKDLVLAYTKAIGASEECTR
ncbi:hypothetical protein M5362_13060 [Streptomyces sp. Je 1-79]|uniref:hypothetical protein n=1 Tax=Streptomyces sp. Je 1-79 TaxID=2943847 RepID=UPI0021A4A3A0|nr:hypothetical protein [Streptomyces sp. Je 1-79]MCT4354060.1 hypothetical protein [Streptomyces sp. Je 1-79]